MDDTSSSSGGAAGAKRKLPAEEDATGAKRTKHQEDDALKLPETLQNVETIKEQTGEELDKMLECAKRTMDKYCAHVIASRNPKHLQLATLMFFGVEGGNAMVKHPSFGNEIGQRQLCKEDNEALLLFRNKIKWVGDFAKEQVTGNMLDPVKIQCANLADLVVEHQFDTGCSGETWRNPCKNDEQRRWLERHFYNHGDNVYEA